MAKKSLIVLTLTGFVFSCAMPQSPVAERRGDYGIVAQYERTLHTPCFKTVRDLLRWSAELGNERAKELLASLPESCLKLPLSRTDVGFEGGTLDEKEKVCFGGVDFKEPKRVVAKELLNKAKEVLRENLCY